MDTLTRHRRIWGLLQKLLSRWIRRKFNFTPEPARLDGPCLVVPNHVTTWDPLLVALSFPKDQMYFVASEHIFRLGLVTRLLLWLVGPISRRKGASGADTAMTCIRRFRQGASICLFAEGDCSWDGRSGGIFPATGKLARSAGVTLVTYRLEGGYLSRPRWGRGLRRGAMRGRVVGVYPPEQLKSMTPEAVNALIERDILEDAWAREAMEQTVFLGKTPAEHLECLLYLCPACGAVGGLHSRGDVLRCRCGFTRRLTPQGGFAPESPFPHPGAWDAWQRRELPALRPGPDGTLFSDTEMCLTEIPPGQRGTRLGVGPMVQYPDRFVCAGMEFPLAEISGMSIHGAQTLAFSFGDRYFEIRAKAPRCTRKYLDYWQHFSRGRRGADAAPHTPE